MKKPAKPKKVGTPRRHEEQTLAQAVGLESKQDLETIVKLYGASVVPDKSLGELFESGEFKPVVEP